MNTLTLDHLDTNALLESVVKEVTHLKGKGEVAGTIPELANVSGDKYGVHLLTVDGEEAGTGDHLERFSIQSISKVLTLTLAFTFRGERIWERMGVEPSGTAFNSLVQLELERGIPRNPFINAGALVLADILISELRDPKKELLSFVRALGNCPDVTYDQRVAESERSSGWRNAALANLLRSFGNLHNDVDEVLDLYFHQCALAMSCRELAHTFRLFATNGIPYDGAPAVLTYSETKRLNALMLTCGFYDESGEFAYKVGLPGKSGIGGGIVAIHPDRFTVATWSPRLNAKGNSVMGMATLERLTTLSGLSIF